MPGATRRTWLVSVAATFVLASVGLSARLRADPSIGSGTRELHRCGHVRVDPAALPRWVELAADEAEVEVRVAGASTPVAGSMAAEASAPTRRFEPVFPFTPGLVYVVRAGDCERRFSVPSEPPPEPVVRAVYPRSETIPENILRFYIYFSEPMADGDFLSHLRLEDVDTGEELTGVFFENIYELWSQDRRRITVLVDPGRVKTGLQAHRRWGRAFTAGHTYRLHVLPTWRSVRGATLREEYTATYRAVAEDRRRVDVGAWQLRPPASGSLEPLIVDFLEPVDHVSVHRMLSVVGASGERVEGRWQLERGERVARFAPRAPWSRDASEHALRADGRFEDIAGNNLGASFDHAIGEVRAEGEDRIVRRRFSVIRNGESNERE